MRILSLDVGTKRIGIAISDELGWTAQGIKTLHRRDSKSDLRGVLGLPILTWDERLSTVEATKILIKGDLSRKKRKRQVDMTAAVLILQSYLDSLARKGNP